MLMSRNPTGARSDREHSPPTLPSISMHRFTPMERKVLEFIKIHQPCTLKDITDSGIKQKTASNILARIKFIKRTSDKVTPGESRRLVYWLDKERAPLRLTEDAARRAAIIKERNTITQDPVIVAFFGMPISQCRANF